MQKLVATARNPSHKQQIADGRWLEISWIVVQLLKQLQATFCLTYNAESAYVVIAKWEKATIELNSSSQATSIRICNVPMLPGIEINKPQVVIPLTWVKQLLPDIFRVLIPRINT